MSRAWIRFLSSTGLVIVGCAPQGSDARRSGSTGLPVPTVLVALASEAVTVRQAHPDENYGSYPLSVVAKPTAARESYVQFPVSGLPAGALVTSAQIQFHVESGDGTADGPRIYRTPTAAWSEESMTWNTRPGITGGALANLGAA